MKAFLTGGTGFVGGRLARLLLERGDEVVALVRSPAKADGLRRLGCALAEGDLGAVTGSMLDGCDAVFHCAAVYEIGIRSSETASMWRINVEGTARVLDAAVEASVPSIVYVSTANVFGDTKGAVVDETFVRDVSRGFLSAYDETKYRAHELVLARVADGAPARIAIPGAVYGPGDTSQLGELIRRAMAGRLPYVSFPTAGVMACYVDDVAAGIAAVHDRGGVGEEYVLGGERVRMRELIDAAARAGGRKPPRFAMPTWVIRAMAPVASLAGPALGLPPNLHETISATDGVTYWADFGKAQRGLGYAPRSLEAGMADLARAAA